MRKMKDSGIEWIGEIPEDWEVTRYGRCVRRVKEYDDNPNKQVLSLTIKGVKTKDLSDNMGKLALDYTGHQIVKKGNLVVTPRDFDCTPILSGIAPCDGCISNLYFILESNGQVYLPYINHQMWGVKYGGDIWKKLSFGMRYSYNYQQFSDIPLAIPPLEEQELIADYLDEKVQEIDNIISKTQKTIEEYKKYKQSVITEAVTKGLNPNVEMKDSGIEWIAEIPKDWKIMKLKNVIKKPLQYGANSSGIEYNEKLPRYIRITDINSNNDLKESGKLSLSIEDAEDYILNDDDILFARSGATVGKTFLFKRNYGVCAFAGYLIRASLKREHLAKFIYYYTLSSSYNEWKNRIFIQATIQNIGADKYSNMEVIIPDSIHEQVNIVDYLDEKCNKIDNLITKKQELITQLETYKKSLIYECVTGKKEVSPVYAY